MDNKWWIERAQEIQQYADANEAQKSYQAIKAIHGSVQNVMYPVKSTDGSIIIKDQQGILSRWAEHLSELLNCMNPHDPNFTDQLPQLPTIPDLDLTPSLHEVSIAVFGLKNNKASGPDDIPAEVLKFGGHALLHRYIASSPVYGTPSSCRSSGRTRTSSPSTSVKGIAQNAVTAEVSLSSQPLAKS